MTTKQCQNTLAVALNEWQPSITFDDIANKIQANRDATPIPSGEVQKRRSTHRWIPLVAAACLIVFIGIGGFILHQNAADAPPIGDAATTLIDIDVNPGIELTINHSDQVMAVDAVNADGQCVLDGLALKKQSLSTAVQLIFEAMIDQGYMANTDNPILVTVQNPDVKEAERIHGIINNNVDAVMSERNLSAAVTNQTVEAFDAAKQFAQAHGISNGKAAFILSMVEQQPTLEADVLAEYTFAALAAIAQHQNIPLSELVDYDAEEGLWTFIVDDLMNDVKDAESSLGVSLVTPEKASQLALKGLHNDWIAENALFVRIELVWKDDIPIYRVEFVSLGYLYEYAISAVDGTFMNPNSSTTTGQSGTVQSTLQGGGTRTDVNTPPTKSTTTTTSPHATGNGISDEQAKVIAFSRLEIEEQEVSGIVVNRNRHSRYGDVILVRFSYRETVYAYHLDKSSGDILCSFSLSEDTPVDEFDIDEWDAIEIALTQAGVQADECGEQTIMFGVDQNQTPYIDVAFAAHGYSYYYRINGKDGSVLTSTIAKLGNDPNTPPS